MFELAAPAWLLLLPLIPALWLWQRRRRTGTEAALLHPQAELLAELAAARPRRDIPWPWLLACALLVLALARPQWLDFDDPRALPGHSIMIAVDVSGSMRALDYVLDGRPASRLDMVKHVLHRFLERARGLRAGIVVFGDDAMTFLPLTTDLTLASRLLDEIDNSLAGERTALGDGIALAVQRLAAVEGPERALVLLTDGTDTGGRVSPEAAADLARRHGVRIYPVGIGSDAPAAFPQGAGEKPVYSESPLDEARLRGLAAATGGRYQRARHGADIDRVLADIERLEREHVPDPRFARVSDWYWLPAVTGLLLLLLNEWRGRRVLPA